MSPSTTRQLADRLSVVISILVVVAFTSSLVVCGSGSGSDTTSGVGSAFAQRALAACHAALEDKQAWRPFPVPDFNPSQPDASKFPEVAAWLDGEVTPTFEKWRDDLVALGDPPSGQAAWNDTLCGRREDRPAERGSDHGGQERRPPSMERRHRRTPQHADRPCRGDGGCRHRCVCRCA